MVSSQYHSTMAEIIEKTSGTNLFLDVLKQLYSTGIAGNFRVSKFSQIKYSFFMSLTSRKGSYILVRFTRFIFTV